MNRSKFCIFCGRSPINKKNKEHVIPQWLNAFSKTKVVSTGFTVNQDKPVERIFGAKNFTFPSCTACNDRYASMEDKVKKIVKKMVYFDFNYMYDEIDILMDWMDKVRIGLWLGYSYLDKDLFNYNPHMSINSRIGIKDRILGIIPTNSVWSGYNYTEVQSPVFYVFPCAIALRIVNAIFINISYDFLVSRNIGLPYSRVIQIESPGKITYPDFKTREIRPPIYNSALLEYGSWYGQAIYPNEKISPIWSKVPELFAPKHRLSLASQKLNPIYFNASSHHWMTGGKFQFEIKMLKIGPKKKDLENYLETIRSFIMEQQLIAFKHYQRFSIFHSKKYFSSIQTRRRIINLQNKRIIAHKKKFKIV